MSENELEGWPYLAKLVSLVALSYTIGFATCAAL